MANKCVAPKCESNYNELKKKEKKKVCRSNPRKRNVYHFPTEPLLRKKRENAAPRKKWSSTNNSVLCDKHFPPSDFKTEQMDKNLSRKRNKDQDLKELKADAVPRQWPDCPPLLSETPPKKRMRSRASSSSRLENQRLREQIERDKARKKDKFGSLAELDRKLDPESLPPDIIVSYSSFSRMFLSVSKDGKPDIDYCLKISESLHFEMWCKDKMIYKKYFPDREIATLLRSTLWLKF